MPAVRPTALPANTLLRVYVGTGAYTDCYAANFPAAVSLTEFMAAFYTTPVFKLERWLLAQALRLPSTDRDAQRLALGETGRFAAWHVEARESDQALLAAGRTRSWLMVLPQPAVRGKVTMLLFGSAVVPRRRGGLGWHFTALLGFHRLYSRILLASAVRRLAQGQA